MTFDIPPLPNGMSSPEFQVWWQQVADSLSEQFDLNDEVVAAINIALRNAGIALDAAQQDMPAPPPLTVYDAGDLPQDVQFYRYEDGSDVTTDSEWSAAVVSGDASVSIGAGTGLLTIASATTDSLIRVQSLRSDLTLTVFFFLYFAAAGTGSGALTVTEISTTTYTLVAADAGKHLRFTHASGCTVTLPTNASAAYAIGGRTRMTAAGAGNVVIAPAGGVTANSRASAFTSAGQFAVFEVEKVGTDEWDCLGDLTP